jgi:adenylate cyclase
LLDSPSFIQLIAIAEGKRIYGDGVNIAARMEGLADIGGICISGTVYDAIESKLGLEYEFLGEQEVKNIEKPVRTYRVLSYPGAAAHRVVKAKQAESKKWRRLTIAVAAVLLIAAAGSGILYRYLAAPAVEKASIEKMAFPLPEKPSIVVLPFENMGGDTDQDYLSAGISEVIIGALSNIPRLFVIARNSSFTYKGKAVKVQQVAEELGVQYVLEGSVQRSGDTLRAAAQLIDALKGHHLWSERYDFGLDDLLAVQDKIALRILVETQVKLTEGEQVRLLKKETDNLKAYEKYLQAKMHHQRTNREDMFKARQPYFDERNSSTESRL